MGSTSEELPAEGESSSMMETLSERPGELDRRWERIVEGGVDNGELGCAVAKVRRDKQPGSGIGGRTICSSSSIFGVYCGSLTLLVDE